MSEKEAVVLLLRAGCVVERGGWHVYRSQKTGEFVLLHFDKRGELISDDEESFPDVNDAAAKFARRAGL